MQGRVRLFRSLRLGNFKKKPQTSRTSPRYQFLRFGPMRLIRQKLFGEGAFEFWVDASKFIRQASTPTSAPQGKAMTTSLAPRSSLPFDLCPLPSNFPFQGRPTGPSLRRFLVGERSALPRALHQTLQGREPEGLPYIMSGRHEACPRGFVYLLASDS